MTYNYDRVDAEVIIAGIVGSTAYGMATPESDVDRIGVYAAPTKRFHGLHLPIDKSATISSHEPDVTLHEARKFCMLALKGNPTLIEIMFLDDYEVLTPEGGELIEIRDSFLSAPAIRNAYLGYATAQFSRLVDTGQFASKQRSRAAKHARHMLRLIDQGFELYTTRNLTIKLQDPDKYIDFGNRVTEDIELARQTLHEASERFTSVETVLPERPDEKTVEEWLLDVRRRN